MTKKINASSIGIAIFALMLVLTTGSKVANASMTNSVKLGSKGESVTQLQQFMRTNPYIYPTGVVSGYFGSLTKAAVIQLQAAYTLSQDGIVGPQTITKINTAMALGVGLDLSAPVISNLSLQTTSNSMSTSFNTNEPTKVQVYYDINPLQIQEESVYGQAPYVSGTLASYTNDFKTSHGISISNLQTNTTYYYLIRTIDSSGNMTVTWPTTFRTN
jgi:peptidoglycan hydrolase-like protein with peptidoglycan-binding domain